MKKCKKNVDGVPVHFYEDVIREQERIIDDLIVQVSKHKKETNLFCWMTIILSLIGVYLLILLY